MHQLVDSLMDCIQATERNGRLASVYRTCNRCELVKGKIGNTSSVGITAASVDAILARMVPSDSGDEASTPPMSS